MENTTPGIMADVFMDIRTAQKAAGGGRQAAAGPGSRRILIVDDDLDATEELASFLNWRFGAEVAVTDSVAAAKSRLADSPTPDLCLVDIRMPRESGMTLVKELRARNAEQPHIIVMSGFHDAGAMETIEQLHLPFLPKPLSLKALVDLVQPFLEDSPQRLAPA